MRQYTIHLGHQTILVNNGKLFVSLPHSRRRHPYPKIYFEVRRMRRNTHRHVGVPIANFCHASMNWGKKHNFLSQPVSNPDAQNVGGHAQSLIPHPWSASVSPALFSASHPIPSLSIPSHPIPFHLTQSCIIYEIPMIPHNRRTWAPP